MWSVRELNQRKRRRVFSFYVTSYLSYASENGMLLNSVLRLSLADRGVCRASMSSLFTSRAVNDEPTTSTRNVKEERQHAKRLPHPMKAAYQQIIHSRHREFGTKNNDAGL